MKKVIKIIGRILSVLSILFVVYAIYRLGFDFSSITNWPVFLAVAFFCILIKTGTVFVMGSAWTDWLHFFSSSIRVKDQKDGKKKLDRRAALTAYVKANIGKYLPGNVMHYVERNLFAADLGISQKQMAAGSVIEVGGLALIAVLMALVFSADSLTKALREALGDGYWRWILLAAGILILICVVLLLIFRKRILALLKDWNPWFFARTLLLALIKYAVVLAALGLIMVFLYQYMGGAVNASTAMQIISGYIIAWVCGFLIPGVSGGIGIRELVIITLLGPVVGEELVLTLSVIHRLITIVGDFLSYFLGLLLQRGKKSS